MATINKQYSFIWYGKCIDTDQVDGGCTSFNLTTEPEAAKIDTVWQVDVQGDAKSWVNGATGTQSFTTLECGHAYYIKLKAAGSYNCEITHAELSGYSQTSGTAFRITEDCKADGGGGGPTQQASIALDNCPPVINLSATQLDTIGIYTTCQLQKTGATFVAISDTTTDKIQYNLTTGGLLSYRIADTADADNSLTTGAITITANADEGFDFFAQSNELQITINGTVTALPKPVINITPTVSSTNTVTFTPDFNNATNWGGTSWKYRLKNAIGQPITNYTTVTNFQSNAIDITNEFDHAGTYTIDAEIVTTGGDSIAGSTKVEDKTINIPRLEANISVGNIAHGSIDRDTLPDTKTASVTATNISGDWAIDTNASNAHITATKNSNDLQSVLNTQELGAINSDNKVTISAQGTKWNQAYSVQINELVLGPASNEVTAECTITAIVTDGVVFTSSSSSVSDNTRDTDDAIPSPTKITITHDDVDSWVASLSSTSTNWKFSTTQTGTYSTDPTTLSKSGLGHAPDTFEFWVKYDTDSVADETLTLTLTESATDSHPDVANITITLTGEVTQAIGTATFSGCTSLDAITFEVGDTSNSTNNNKTCTLTTTDCTVTDVTETTLGIFTYTITSDVVNYWITDASSVQSTETETLAITANADTNFAFGGSSTKTINVTLSGTVEAATIPENSSIANGACPSDISHDASTTATQTSCQLTLVNAVCVPITNAVHGGLKYSLTAQGLLTYEANDPESVGEHSHEVTITANSTDSSASLFAGQAQTVTHKVTMKITVNTAVVADDLLWVNFGFADATKQIASDWYELEQVSEVITRVDFDNASYAQMAGFANAVVPVRWVNASGQDYATANSAEDEPLTPQQIIDMATDSGTMVFNHATMTVFAQFPMQTATLTALGLTADDLTGLPILSDDGGATLYVNKQVELDYTKFQIASSDSAYATELQSWLDTNSVSSIRGLMMTTSPTRPNTLTAPLATKAFNDAELLNLHCNVSECGPETNSSDALNFRLIADVKTANSVTSQEGKYTFNCSAANYIGEGKPWENAYAVLTNASGGQIDKSDDPASAGIVITDMYFIAGSFGAIATETKVKLSTLCS